MKVKEKIYIFIEQLKDRESFTRQELYDFFKSYEPDLNNNTFAWRIYDLKNRDIIKSVRCGIYTFHQKPQFEPPADRKLSRIHKLIQNRYNLEKICIWDTVWLHDFMLHQPASSLKIIEVEKDALESIFYFLKDTNNRNVFLYPDEPLMDKYVSEEIKPIIIKPFISRSPVVNIKNKTYPMIEKVLVDIFCDTVLFKIYQSSELVRIFTQVYKQYTLNFSTMITYVKRRGKGTELIDFLYSEIRIPMELIK